MRWMDRLGDDSCLYEPRSLTEDEAPVYKVEVGCASAGKWLCGDAG